MVSPSLPLQAPSNGNATISKAKGIITAKVKIKIEAPAVITAIISKEAVEELDVKVGDTIEAVIKATEVMVAKEH